MEIKPEKRTRVCEYCGKTYTRTGNRQKFCTVICRTTKYQIDNKEKITEYDKRYRQANKKRNAENAKIYYKENRDKIAARKKKHYEKTKTK